MGVGDPTRERVARIEPAGPSPVAWDRLRNPILSDEHRIKDQTLAYRDGVFHLFASGRHYRSRDLLRWDSAPDRTFGSPELVVDTPLGYVMVAQMADPASDHPRDRRLGWRTSPDLETWTEWRELFPEMPRDRNIDGALAWANGRFVLGWKRGKLLQHFSVAESPGPDTKGVWPWSSPRRAQAGEGCLLDALPLVADNITRWAENYQFLRIDGRWRMVATARHPDRPVDRGYVGSHEPYIYALGGDGSDLAHWTRWVDKRLLHVPTEDWNTLMHANTGHLVDARRLDGFFYLFYSGANELDPDGRGHASIGGARSVDLVRWEVPGR